MTIYADVYHFYPEAESIPLCQGCLSGAKVALLTINGCFLATFQKDRAPFIIIIFLNT